jgi:hypothetical protein
LASVTVPVVVPFIVTDTPDKGWPLSSVILPLTLIAWYVSQAEPVRPGMKFLTLAKAWTQEIPNKSKVRLAKLEMRLSMLLLEEPDPQAVIEYIICTIWV